jgi:hypothetical protein
MGLLPNVTCCWRNEERVDRGDTSDQSRVAGGFWGGRVDSTPITAGGDDDGRTP